MGYLQAGPPRSPASAEVSTPRPFEGLLKDAAGKPSTMRVLFVLWAVAVLVVWVIVSLRTDKVQDIPTSIATILAMFVGGKAVQSFAETWRQRPA